MPVTVPRSHAWEVAREVGSGDRTMLVSLAWPDQPPPPAGYPALVVLDAPVLFGTAVEAARLQAGRPGATGVAPGVVIGLGHPGDPATRAAARRRDYTPPPDGAADDILDTLERSVLPAVERIAPLDRTRLAVFGHSVAGLLPVHALLTRPGLFARCVAASPSLWWNDGVLLRRARHAAAAPPPGLAQARLLLTIGGLERPDTPAALRDPARAARAQDARMIGNARDLAAILSPVLSVRCVEFPDENHGSVVPAALSRAMPFALGTAS